MTRCVALVLFALGCVAPALSQDSNSIWVLWERSAAPTCPDGEACPVERGFQSHFINRIGASDAETLFQSLAPIASALGQANLSHDSLPTCTAAPAAPVDGALDTAGMEPVDKADTLRGLDSVYIDASGLRGPPGYAGEFGATLQRMIEAQFRAANIPILSRAAMEQAPGRPELILRYSVEVRGCRPWSVSLSLNQDLLLARDLTMLVRSSTWAASTRQDETDVDYTAELAAEDAIKAFVLDYLTANDLLPGAAAVAN